MAKISNKTPCAARDKRLDSRMAWGIQSGRLRVAFGGVGRERRFLPAIRCCPEAFAGSTIQLLKKSDGPKRLVVLSTGLVAQAVIEDVGVEDVGVFEKNVLVSPHGGTLKRHHQRVNSRSGQGTV
jgi:hypothetical protein